MSISKRLQVRSLHEARDARAEQNEALDGDVQRCECEQNEDDWIGPRVVFFVQELVDAETDCDDSKKVRE